ncbi:MAG: hypothetical protein AB8V83_00185 [Coxiella endosymbiont of Dermacentor silvarum]
MMTLDNTFCSRNFFFKKMTKVNRVKGFRNISFLNKARTENSLALVCTSFIPNEGILLHAKIAFCISTEIFSNYFG